MYSISRRVFIENDYEVHFFERNCFEGLTHLKWDTSFSQIITSAWCKKEMVLQAIGQCEEIWISSLLIGPSYEQFKEMCQLALHYELKDKIVYNLASKEQLFNILPPTCLEQLNRNNIIFLYREDIRNKFHQPQF